MYCDLSLSLAQCFLPWYGLHLSDSPALGMDYGTRPRERLGLGNGSPLGMVILQVVAHIEHKETLCPLTDGIQQ